MQLEQDLCLEYENTCLQEEMLWMQKSRDTWIKLGDRNTAYFHSKTIARRRRNRILTIQDHEGVWQSDAETLKGMTQSFFRDLYSAPEEPLPPYHIRGHFPTLPNDAYSSLARDITLEEVRKGIFDMSPLKAPGEDGLPALFFQNQWETTSPTIFKLVQDAFRNKVLPPAINRTMITLIPKLEHPKSLRDFRPISLCTVAYKVITKIVANHIKCLLPNLILPYQTSFITGRNITDNIIIAQEAIHSMRQKRGRVGWLAIKVDLEKAFDRLRWEFIADTLRDVGFPCDLIDLTMACISSSSMKVLWNGQPSESFQPSRGVRQGDPLSPYIFVLCMERLSQAIEAEVNKGT